VKLLGEGGLGRGGGGGTGPLGFTWASVILHLFYGFFNKNISDDVQHLVKIPPSPPPSPP